MIVIDTGMTDLGMHMGWVGNFVFSVGKHPPKHLPSLSTRPGIHCLSPVCGLQNFRLADIRTLGFVPTSTLPWILRITITPSISLNQKPSAIKIVNTSIILERKSSIQTWKKHLFWKYFFSKHRKRNIERILNCIIFNKENLDCTHETILYRR